MAEYVVLRGFTSPYLRILDADTWSDVTGWSAFTASVTDAAWSPDGTRLALTHGGTGGLRILNVSDWSDVGGLPSLPGVGRSVAWSPDGQYLAVGFDGSPYYRIYATADWSLVAGTAAVPEPSTVNSLAWSPDGAHLAMAWASGPSYFGVLQSAGWAFVSGTPARSASNTRLAFSPDGSMLLLDLQPTPKVLNASTWAVVSGLPSISSVVGAAWRPDGARLGLGVYGWPDSQFRELQVSDWAQVTLQTLTGEINGFTYSGDGSKIAYPYWAGAPQWGAKFAAASDVSLLHTSAPPPAVSGILFLSAAAAPEELVSVPWPITISAAAQQTVSVFWPITVATPATAAVSWPITVLDASVLAGLDGAGGWAAAPDGRWQPIVVLDGTDISDRLTGEIVVQCADDAARTASFAFVPASPLQPMGLIGRPVRIAFAQAGGLNVQLMFSGVIDVPTIDLQTGAVSCSCHDQAQEIWAATSTDVIDAIVGGRWHVAVSGEPDDSFDYLGERIASVGASWALDAMQHPTILPWRGLPRAATVKAADVIDGTLEIDLPSREQIRSRVTVTFQYRYPVFKARGAVAQYAQTIRFFLPDSTPTQERPGRQWLTVAMIDGATSGASGWTLQAEPTVAHPVAGSYLLDGTGADPEAIYIITPRVAQELATGFSARYATRWQQSVTENYTIDVVWSAMEAQLGQPVAEETGATLEAVFDTPEWGSDDSVEPVISAPLAGDTVLPWQPVGYDAASRDEAIRTLLDRAWIRLWGASRSGRVRFSVPARPDLWLDVWLTLQTDTINAAGKITEIEHRMNLDTGEAVTQIAVAVGMPGNASESLPAWSLPAAPVDDYTPPASAYSFQIDTHVGGEATSPPWDEETMTGFITNLDGATINGREYYPHKLTMVSPPLAEEDRDPRELTAEETINVAVPTDLLEIL